MSQAIFLSYSSEDAEAARRICDTMRAAGLEVWFDQSELRSGDVWDAKIKQQIAECALFMPIISRSTEARREGYFRLEWRLADQRTHLMARSKAFLVPVCIDDTEDQGSEVPESFMTVQWTRLRNGETSESFCERTKVLLRGEPAKQAALASKPAATNMPKPAWKSPILLALVTLLTFAAALFAIFGRVPGTGVAKVVETTITEAQKLVDQARTLFAESVVVTSKLDAAFAVAERAVSLDPTNADGLAIASQIESHKLLWESTPERIERARSRSEKAVNLAPQALESRIAQAWYVVAGLGQPQSSGVDGELLALQKALPNDWRVNWILASLRWDQGRMEEVASILEDGAKIPGWTSAALTQKAVMLASIGRYQDAEQTIDRALTMPAPANASTHKAFLEMSWRGNLDGALAALNKMSVQDQFSDFGVASFVRLYRLRREPENFLKVLSQYPRLWLGASVRAPKAALKGDAYAELGQLDSAREEWRLALKLIDERLTALPNDRPLLEWRAYLLAELGERSNAQALWKRVQSLPRPATNAVEKTRLLGSDAEIMAELEYRAAPLDANAARPISGRPFISAADLRLNPAWDRVRPLPRFTALLARLEKDARFAPENAVSEPAALTK